MFQKKEVPLEVEIPTLHNPIKSHPFFYCEILFHSEMCHITKVQWFMCEVLLNCNGSTSFSNSSAHDDTTQSQRCHHLSHIWYLQTIIPPSLSSNWRDCVLHLLMVQGC